MSGPPPPGQHPPPPPGQTYPQVRIKCIIIMIIFVFLWISFTFAMLVSCICIISNNLVWVACGTDKIILPALQKYCSSQFQKHPYPPPCANSWAFYFFKKMWSNSLPCWQFRWSIAPPASTSPTMYKSDCLKIVPVVYSNLNIILKPTWNI